MTTAPTVTENPVTHIILSGDIGMDQHGRVWFQGDDGTPTLYSRVPHPLAHRAGFAAFVWMLGASNRWSELTRAQRRALLDPTHERLRCLPALRDKGYLDGLTRTPDGELLTRWAKAMRQPETLAKGEKR